MQELKEKLRAGYPGIYLLTQEDKRAGIEVKGVCEELGRHLYVWGAASGWQRIDGESKSKVDPENVVERVRGLPEKTVVILQDFHFYLQAAECIAQVKDMLEENKMRRRCTIFLSARKVLPPEMERLVSVVELGLPGKDELRKVVDGISRSAEAMDGYEAPADDAELETVLDSLSGLTTVEAENALSLSVIRAKRLDPTLIGREKCQEIGKGGLLELSEQPATLDDVGGLGTLKEWLRRRGKAFSEEAREYGLPVPKGILLVGIPGCGKSLTAKAVSALWRLPLLRLDVGKLFGELVGQSEENLRRTLEVAEAVSPCVLWVDEIEKAFAGATSSLDSGTSARVFGGFLTWMQEKQKPVFVFATANDVAHLPPEMMRKGRFDELFFVDLPTEAEREEIVEIHIKKRNRNPEAFGRSMIASRCAGYSGAEIEAAIVEAMFAAFDAGREVVAADIVLALERTCPLSETMKEKVDALRDWSTGRARNATPQDGSNGAPAQYERKIE